jgi:hypothetical protein
MTFLFARRYDSGNSLLNKHGKSKKIKIADTVEGFYQ